MTALQAAASASEADKAATAQVAIPRIDSLLGRTQEFDKAGRAFHAGFEACPGEVKGAAGELTNPTAK